MFRYQSYCRRCWAPMPAAIKDDRFFSNATFKPVRGNLKGRHGLSPNLMRPLHES
jgi:hypothetical protein